MMHMWRSEDNLKEQLSFHHVGPGEETQAASLGYNCLNPLAHLTGSCPNFKAGIHNSHYPQLLPSGFREPLQTPAKQAHAPIKHGDCLYWGTPATKEFALASLYTVCSIYVTLLSEIKEKTPLTYSNSHQLIISVKKNKTTFLCATESPATT